MESTLVAQLLAEYIPGFWIFVILVMIHTLLSTIAHIKVGDFSFSKWPRYMINFIFFMVFIGIVNALVALGRDSIQNDTISTLLIGVQALFYLQPICYYIDNILLHSSQLGIPVSPELIEIIRNLKGKARDII